MRPSLWDGVSLAAASLVVILGYGPLAESHVFGYDEADYRTAVESGIASHWLDEPSIPLSDFLSAGTRREDSLSLSERIRDSGDLPFLRHYHGPVYWYALIPALALVPEGEKAARSTGLVWLLALAFEVYLGCLWVGQGRASATVALALVVLSPQLVDGSLLLSSHGVYAVVATAALFLAGRALQTGSPSLWLATSTTLALALATLEYAAFLVAATLGVSLLAGRRIPWARSSLVVFGALFLLWPGGFLHLTLLRSYLFFGYLSLLRPQAFGSLGPLEAWAVRFGEFPVGWLLLSALGLVFAWHWWRARKEETWAAPFLVYGALFLATTSLNRSPHPRFLLSLVPALAVLAAAGLGRVRARLPRIPEPVLAGILIAVLAFACFRAPAIRARRAAPRPIALDGVVASLRSDPPARALVPQELLPTVRWYLPSADVRGYLTADQLATLAARRRPDAVVSSGLSDAEVRSAVALPVVRTDAPSPGIVVFRFHPAGR